MIVIGFGTTGVRIAVLVTEALTRFAVRRQPKQEREIRRLLGRLISTIGWDSAPPSQVAMTGRLEGEGIELVAPPGYLPIQSPSGRTVLERLDEPRLASVRELLDHLGPEAAKALSGKPGSAEAAASRFFGLVNVLPELEDRQAEFDRAVTVIDEERRHGTSVADLYALTGLRIDPDRRRIVVIEGFGGGQGTALSVVGKVIISAAIDSSRERTDLIAHMILPGYVQQDAVERSRVEARAFATLSDNLAVKSGLLPFLPQSMAHVTPSIAAGIWNEVVVHHGEHHGTVAASLDRLACRIAADLVGPLAADVSTWRSNAATAIREAVAIPIVGAKKGVNHVF